MTESPNKPEKTVLDMIKVIIGEQFLNSDCENAITVALNPTTMLVGLNHKSAIDKLHAMSTEDHWNRMKVGSRFADSGHGGNLAAHLPDHGCGFAFEAATRWLRLTWAGGGRDDMGD